MPFDTALGSTEYTYLRGSSSLAPTFQGSVYLSVVPNTNVYTARVNQSIFNYPIPEVTYDGGSGTLANVKVGHTVLISHTNDRTAIHWRGRVRAAPTASVLYLNANAADIQDNDYIFIIDDFQVWDKLPRDQAGFPVPDWDVAFRKLLPIISNLRSFYAGFISSSVLTIAFAPDVNAAADGATISTYAWDVGDGTITVGSGSTKNITATFPAGFRWISFTVTDSNSNSLTRRLPVWAHDTSANAPTPIQFEDLSVSCELSINPNEGAGSGYNATVNAFAGVSSILDQTLVCAFTVEAYNGTAVSIGSAGNILMTGRFRSEDNDTDYDQESGQQNGQVAYQIDGVLNQMSGLRFPILEIFDSASPTIFNEIKDITVWRAVWLILTEYSTFASLHSLAFDDLTEAFRQPGFVTNGGDLLYTIADLLQRIDAVLQDNRAGMCEVARRGVMLPSADRSGITTVANWTKADYLKIKYRRDYFQSIGNLRGTGGGYNTTTNENSSYDVRAPRGTAASGAGEAQLYRQVLIADQSIANEKAELEQRAGDALAAQQSPEVLIVTLKDGYHWLTPDAKAWYTWTIAADETVRGKTFDTSVRWWLQSIQVGHNPQTGAKEEVVATFVRETDGVDGQIIVYPELDLGSYPIDLGNLDDFTMPPPSDTGGFRTDPGDWSPDLNGHCVDGKNYVDAQFDIGEIVTIKTVTITYNATGTLTGFRNKLRLRSPSEFYTVYASWNTLAGTGNTITLDVGGVPAEFIQITAYGDYDSCDDTIAITDVSYTTIGAPSASPKCLSINFRETPGGFFATEPGFDPSHTYGIWVAGQGWQNQFDAVQGYACNINNLALLPSGTTIIRIEVDVTYFNDYFTFFKLYGAIGGTVFIDEYNAGHGVGDYTYVWTGSQEIDNIGIFDRNTNGSAPYNYIRAIRLCWA